MTTIDTSIAGIPCQARMTSFEPGQSGVTLGAPERCREHFAPEIGFEILDRNGRPAPWLGRKMTPTEGARIADELFGALEAANEPDYCLED